MPLQATSGAASYDGFGGGVVAEPNYIESCFSTYLYTGTGASQTITNGIDLSTKGGLVWTKRRDDVSFHGFFDTIRGATNYISSNNTDAQATNATTLTAFNSNGFSLGADGNVNRNTNTFASWTFRKQPKFFDVVTYTGDGTAGRTVAHNLGSVPGCMIVKRTNTTGEWEVYHRSIGNTGFLALNTTDPTTTAIGRWNNTTPTSTVFTLGNSSLVNNLNDTYVAYLFAHDAGGFGLTGTDNVISCGSYTGNGSAQTISLGYEPQWVMIKSSSLVDTNWTIFDSMRGIVTATGVSGDAALVPNTSNAEVATDALSVTATGFIAETNTTHYNRSGNTYIYIAIRRGPMKVPTSGTSVFSPIAANNAQGTQNTTGFPVDLQLQAWRSGVNSKIAVDRLRGVSTTATNGEKYLVTDTTAAEVAGTNLTQYWNNTGFQTASGWASFSNVYWNFGRAPSFFDEVCYTGDGTGVRNITHNLSAVPEMMIVKSRSAVAGWQVYHSALGNTKYLQLNNTGASATATDRWNDTTPTASVFTISSGATVNTSGATYVAYLFATCAGVSKVGSYTGTGTTKQINCGFTGGARFVLIKRTDSTGDWYVWDSARGIVAGNDPYLLLNSTAAEVTSTDYIDTYSAGFEISSTAPAAINASGGTFIFLAIA